MGPLLGVLDHGLGQAVRLELVGVMATQLPAVGLGHFLVRGARHGLEHTVSLIELLHALLPCLPLPEGPAADAVSALDMGEFEHRDVESRRDAPQELPDGPFHVVSGERCPDLQLHEDPRQLGPARTHPGKGCQLRRQIEAGLLARREMLHGRAHLQGIQPQIRHDRARRGNLGFRDAAVGLGEVPHHAEGPPEEGLADRSEVLASVQAWSLLCAARLLVELMAQHHTYGCPHRSPREQSQGAADHFARPLHHHCYSTKRRRRGR